MFKPEGNIVIAGILKIIHGIKGRVGVKNRFVADMIFQKQGRNLTKYITRINPVF